MEYAIKRADYYWAIKAYLEGRNDSVKKRNVCLGKFLLASKQYALLDKLTPQCLFFTLFGFNIETFYFRGKAGFCGNAFFLNPHSAANDLFQLDEGLSFVFELASGPLGFDYDDAVAVYPAILLF